MNFDNYDFLDTSKFAGKIKPAPALIAAATPCAVSTLSLIHISEPTRPY